MADDTHPKQGVLRTTAGGSESLRMHPDVQLMVNWPPTTLGELSSTQIELS